MPHNILAKGLLLFGCISLFQINRSGAQMQPADTLHLELKQAEKLFLDSNLALLAQYYNVSSSKALVEQARKWDNPQLSTNQNIYNSEEGFFKHGTVRDSAGNKNPQGEIYADVEQLIRTAGKRKKQVDLARTNVNLAEWQFKSTMRTLRMTLTTDFYTIAQLEGVARLYDDNLTRLTRLIGAMKNQLQAGNIAQKEYLRVQALTVGLQQDMTENASSLSDAEAELKTILRITGNVFIQPVVSEEETAEVPAQGIMELIDTARRYNTDYQMEVYQLQYQHQNYSLQKAFAYPDVTLGIDFDQHATYAPDYFGLNIGLPLPLWDRNQGNIKSARFQVKQEEANILQAENKLKNDVLNSYQKLLLVIKLSSGTNDQFYKDYYRIYKNVVDAFNNRQISLLEFLDYFKDYEDIRQKQLQQILDLRLAKKNMNDILGIDVIH